jgi:predicted transposase YbfD/YdcC
MGLQKRSHTRTAKNRGEVVRAIPELLRVSELKECIITIDAMGCQKNIAEHIREKGADYVFALKGNHGLSNI